MNRRESVLKAPVITEKSTLLKENLQVLAFNVLRDANKIEIKRAVETAFKVKVENVRVLVRKAGSKTKHGRVVGKVSGWKKAYVTLAKGDKIEFFEGV